jgi:hypothetical protein
MPRLRRRDARAVPRWRQRAGAIRRQNYGLRDLSSIQPRQHFDGIDDPTGRTGHGHLGPKMLYCCGAADVVERRSKSKGRADAASKIQVRLVKRHLDVNF